MSDDLTVTKNNTLSALDPSLLQHAESEKAKNKGEIGQQEFLTLLVTQLKNQDPLDPMSNEDFAVDLAQFSQLEQLVEINKNLGGSEAGDFGSMASYLGKDIVFDRNAINVQDGSGDAVIYELGTAASNVRIELFDTDGNMVEAVKLGEQEAGRKRVTLEDLAARDGEYEVRVTALGLDGQTTLPEVAVGGMVTGFVPGANPVLIVGGREVSPMDIKEVRMIED